MYKRQAAAPFRTARGIALVYTGRYDEAETEFEAAIEALSSADDAAALTMSLAGLGMARQHREDHRGALDAYAAALEAARRGGDLRAEATITMNIATAHHAANNWNEAKRHYNRALVLARQVGASADEVRILSNLGNLLLTMGDPEGALGLIELALKGAKRLGLEAYRAYAHLLRGDVLKLSLIHI